LADVACTSFFSAKPLGCYGGGGMCFTDNDELTAALDSILVHGKGSHKKYDNARTGINGRLDTLQATILLAKFEIFPEEVQLRREVANRYTALLDGASVRLPHIPPDDLSVWAQYSVLAKDEAHRAALLKGLQEAKIPAAIYYPQAPAPVDGLRVPGLCAGRVPRQRRSRKPDLQPTHAPVP
jgi:dTDP-4-amino-4,6-dideoxygalactose transaminase